MTDRTRAIRVLIADDNRVVRKGLRVQLEQAAGIRVVGEASTGAHAVSIAISERADVVLMDVQMADMSGIQATRELLRGDADLKPAVIMMTSYAFDTYVFEAFDAGAVGYLLKNHDADQIVAAVRAAAKGEARVSVGITASLLNEFKRRGDAVMPPAESKTLTGAERRVVDTLVSGVTSNEDIAQALHVSVNTVRSQLRSVLRKIGLRDRTQLAIWGLRNGLGGKSP